MGTKGPTLKAGESLEEVYVNVCKAMPDDCTVIIQNIHRVEPYSELFYAQVMVNGSFQLRGMLDTGSMACTISAEAEEALLAQNILTQTEQMAKRIILIGCGVGTSQSQVHVQCRTERVWYPLHCSSASSSWSEG